MSLKVVIRCDPRAMKMFLLLVVVVCAGTAAAFEREECEDMSFLCKSWKRYCNDPYNKAYMQMNCKKTCGWCPKCEDLTPKCKSMNCDDPKSEDFLRMNCRMTCGICAVPTLAPPPPPTPTWKVLPAGKCGIPKVQGSRIIGGVDAKKGAWPWQVLITLAGGPHCGGSLISPFWVVTAAHCMYRKEELIDEFKIVTGDDDFNVAEGTETTVGVSKIIVNPGFNNNALDYDIALIKLNRPAPFGKYVSTVCLPQHNKPVAVGTKCTITGWGKIHKFDEMYHKLQQANLPIVDNSACYNLNTNTTGVKITPRMMCAGYGPDKRTSGCHGDSGGPLVCQSASGQWVLQGAVSWGSSTCNTAQAYTVFARVSNLRKWIDNTMSAN